ncbi:hypothetical protein NliqN6_3464 [Naganishia liquefaciens]|uniref:Uncharacterized protein n=1 Tax=Naganishia liquefaciens TaxID=104408 RepID=A0A8H3TTU3_9TREE|nr:hypothetical protein NliqN6_3464 [Naganishia liquefaciens]
MVNAKTPSTFFDLVKGMRGKATIGNWDVLVSYDEIALNKLLSEQADKNKLLEEIKVETSVLNISPRKQIPVHMKMKLSSPVFSFGPSDSEAHLRLSLSGSYTLGEDPEVLTLPEDYAVDIRVTLSSAVGHFSGDDFIKKDAEGAAQAGTILGVPDDDDMLCGLYLDFPTGSDAWKMADKDAKALFAYGIWIKIKNGTGQSNGAEGFDSFDMHPIPKDRTASVIFGHNLLVDMVLKPSLEENCFSWMYSVRAATAEDGDPDGSYHGAHLKAPCRVNNDGELSFFKKDEMSGDIDISINSDIAVADQPSLQITWDSKISTVAGAVILGPDGMGNAVESINRQSQIRGSGSWTGSGTEIDMNTAVKRTLVEKHETSILWKEFGLASTTVDISLSCDVKPLQYLLATNLLFPHQKVFSADPVEGPKGSAQQYLTGGFACPHDLILTGNFMDKAVPA